MIFSRHIHVTKRDEYYTQYSVTRRSVQYGHEVINRTSAIVLPENFVYNINVVSEELINDNSGYLRLPVPASPSVR
jgi:hypothetical protein